VGRKWAYPITTGKGRGPYKGDHRSPGVDGPRGGQPEQNTTSKKMRRGKQKRIGGNPSGEVMTGTALKKLHHRVSKECHSKKGKIRGSSFGKKKKDSMNKNAQ